MVELEATSTARPGFKPVSVTGCPLLTNRKGTNLPESDDEKPELLSDEELDELASGQPEAPEGPGRQVYQYVRPLAAAADDYLDMLLNDEGRWMFGIRPLDAMIRGTGRGELTFITGKAHSGKTQLALQSIANNPDKRVVLFTPDEVDALVLSKLVSVTRAIPSDELEKMIHSSRFPSMDRLEESHGQ